MDAAKQPGPEVASLKIADTPDVTDLGNVQVHEPGEYRVLFSPLDPRRTAPRNSLLIPGIGYVSIIPQWIVASIGASRGMDATE